jgi:mycothiol synthase
MNLPEGIRARPIADADVNDVVAMVNECELHDTGAVMLERADLVADAGTEGFDRERDWVMVLDRERVIGHGTLVDRRSAWIDVHPTARGRGIGT